MESPKLPLASPLKILSSSYKSTHFPTQIPEEAKQDVERATKSMEAIQKRVDSLRQKTLSTQPLSKEEKGVNITEFQIVEGKKIAIKKKLEDATWGTEIARMLGKSHKEGHLLGVMGGINETLAANLDILMGGMLGIPLALTEEKGTTSHAFVESKGSYRQVLASDPKLPHKMPPLAAQHFVLAELITGNVDCHKKNILIANDNAPIPIDFGRILPPDPSDPEGMLRAGYLKFGCLIDEINEEDKEYFRKLNISQLIDTLKEELFTQYKEELKEPLVRESLNKSLSVLKARLIMIQEGIRADLNLKQLIALDLPPLPDHVAQFFDIEAGELAKKDPQFKNRQTIVKLRQTLLIHLNQVGFRKAFNEAYQPTKKELDEKTFRSSIRGEIQKVSSLSFFELYDDVTEGIYKLVDADVS